MATIPTESRIFADRYFREAKRIEALHAAMLSPGATTWGAALDALFTRMEAVGSSIKQAALVRQAIAALNSIPDEQAMHIALAWHTGGKRSAGMVFGTFCAGRHPLGLDENGLLFLLHSVVTGRSRTAMRADAVQTYISKHAMARLHERGRRLTAGSAYDVFGYLGVLGLLTRYSARHSKSGVCLLHGDVLAVGSRKHGAVRGSKLLDDTFLDIRTVLPADEVSSQAMLAQGRSACAVVDEWLPDRDIRRARELTAKIPYLPRREDDFTLKAVRA